MVPKDIIICDYERPDQTAVYFAMKGFKVVTCPWKAPKVAVAQTQDMVRFRRSSTPEMKERFLGIVQTVWSDAGQFLEKDYKGQSDPDSQNPWASFLATSEEIQRLAKAGEGK